jgi:hypothetical protein
MCYAGAYDCNETFDINDIGGLGEIPIDQIKSSLLSPCQREKVVPTKSMIRISGSRDFEELLRAWRNVKNLLDKIELGKDQRGLNAFYRQYQIEQ